MKIVLASSNEHKVKEINAIVTGLGIEFILPPKGFDPIEDGETFEENAIIKAKSGLAQTGYITVADDSGICVDYLNGRPGVYSARYSGEHGNDEKNNDKLLSELDGVPMEKRTAYYVAAIACVFPDGRQFTVRGECHGHIAFERQSGNGGFGYDPLFISENGPFSQLSPEQKDAISHRGKALKIFEEKLKEYIEVE